MNHCRDTICEPLQSKVACCSVCECVPSAADVKLLHETGKKQRGKEGGVGVRVCADGEDEEGMTEKGGRKAAVSYCFYNGPVQLEDWIYTGGNGCRQMD